MKHPPPTDRTEAGVAYLEDARKRRKRHSPPADPPVTVEEPQPEPAGADSLGFATNLAAAVKRPASSEPTSSADEILAQHEAASTTVVDDAPPSAPPEPGPADEILRALEVHHQRAEPHQRHHAPRGSADLDAHQPQRPRSKPAKPARARRTLTLPRPRRRVLVGSGLAVLLLAIAIAVNGGGSAASNTAANQGAATDNTLIASAAKASLVAGDYPIHGKLIATHHQAGAVARSRKPAHHQARHAKRPPAVHHTAAVVASSSPAPAVSTASSPARSSASTASESQTSSSSSGGSSGASSRQPAGPAGTGATVGGNCDPKCS